MPFISHSRSTRTSGHKGRPWRVFVKVIEKRRDARMTSSLVLLAMYVTSFHPRNRKSVLPPRRSPSVRKLLIASDDTYVAHDNNFWSFADSSHESFIGYQGSLIWHDLILGRKQCYRRINRPVDFFEVMHCSLFVDRKYLGGDSW